MPDLDPARELSSPGTSEPKRHSPNVFAAPGAHHPLPAFAAGGSKVPDWPSILDGLPFGLVVLGPRQELRHENEACRRLTGRGIAEAGGVESWLAALCPDPEHREKVVRSWREEIWRNQLTRTFTLRTAEQKPKEIEFRSSLLRDGGITLTLDDVTEARRAEESSRHGKLRFRALFTHTREGALLVDRTGRIIDANPAFLAMSGRTLKELRLAALSDLVQSESGEAEGADADPAPLRRVVRLRTATGERAMGSIRCSVGEPGEPSPMDIHLFDPAEPGDALADRIRSRLRVVAQKAQALLNAVPDLILLINEDGTLADFAPPPSPWPDLVPDEGWRGRPLSETWPVLGGLLEKCRPQVLGEARTVHAGIRATGEGGFEFSATFASCGDGQILAVVRNCSDERAARERELWQAAAFERAPLAMLRLDAQGRVANANAAAAALFGEGGAKPGEGGFLPSDSLPPGVVAEFLALEHEGKPRGSLVFLSPEPSSPPEAAVARSAQERRQHGFRNQLQLVTSLFSLEPQSAAAREAFLKWQVRLRSMAQACPCDDRTTVWLLPLVRDLADEVCSLVGRGPGRREVIATGDESLVVDATSAPALGLLMGELMRLALATRQSGPGAGLYIDARPHPGGGFRIAVRPGANRVFAFADREAEIETLELLADQLQGRLDPAEPGDSAKEWTLVVPRRPR